MAPAWVTDLRDQCRSAGIAFFFKQWGGTNKKKAGRVLEGRTYEELPRTAPRPAEDESPARAHLVGSLE